MGFAFWSIVKFPDVVRDPRDVMVSRYYYNYWYVRYIQGGRKYSARSRFRHACLRSPWLRGLHFSRFVRQHLPAWQDHVRHALRNGPLAVIRYEDFLLDSEASLAALLHALGAEVAPETISRVVDTLEFKKMAKRVKRSEVEPSFFRKGVAGDWRTHFRSRDLAFLESTIDDRLRSFLLG